MGVLTVVSLFSGCGGLDFGAHLCGGFRTISYCEAIPYRQGILMSLMSRGALDTAPVHDDVKTFDATGFAGCVDVVAGGDPCQPHSLAGKRQGLKDARWLWPHFKRIIQECRPRFVLRENVPGTVFTGGLITVLEDLESLGYRAAPYQISAAEVGAWHLRKRIFVIAHLDQKRKRQFIQPEPGGKGTTENIRSGEIISDLTEIRRLTWRPEPEGQQLQRREAGKKRDWLGAPGGPNWWDAEPGVGRMVCRCPYRVDRIGALGDIVVPQQSVPAWQKIRDMSEGICPSTSAT